MIVEFAAEALEDLAGILEFISRSDPRAAARLVNGIEQSCEQLGQMPGMGTMRDDWKPGLRVLSHGKYLICFRKKNDDVLRVVRVIHGARHIQPSDF